jgi:hypothetical protein
LVDQKCHFGYNVCIVNKKEQEMAQITYKVGDEVSYGIGGDRYFDGRIVRITKRFIFTDSGKKYTQKVARDGRTYYTETGCRYCFLVPGKQEYLDPHF